MRKSTKIIQIAGIRGILMVLFIGVCLVAGFILFPAKVFMHLWNTYMTANLMLPHINIWQGLLLWAGVALSCYIANGGSMLVSMHEPSQLNEDEMKILMERIKLQAKARKLNAMLMKSNNFKEVSKIEHSDKKDISNVSEDVNENKS